MRAVIQRVSRAQVSVEGIICGQIAQGLVVFLGVAKSDSEADTQWMADKIAQLRLFSDDQGKLNLSALDLKMPILLISQFTLYGDCRKGRRPGFDQAAEPLLAEALYLDCSKALQDCGLHVEHGRFRTKMAVELINDGPVTLLLDSQKNF